LGIGKRDSGRIFGRVKLLGLAGFRRGFFECNHARFSHTTRAPPNPGEALSHYFLLTALFTFCVTSASASVTSPAGTALHSAAPAGGTADAFHAAFLCSYDIRDCSAQDSDEHYNQYHIFHGPLLSTHRFPPAPGCRSQRLPPPTKALMHAALPHAPVQAYGLYS
jgi:hypothetical protein